MTGANPELVTYRAPHAVGGQCSPRARAGVCRAGVVMGGQVGAEWAGEDTMGPGRVLGGRGNKARPIMERWGQC